MADFLATAEMKSEGFESIKANTVVLESNAFVQALHEPTQEQLAMQKEFWNTLRVPRRPKWNRQMEASVLHQMERDSFIDWRRQLAVVEAQDNIQMTPYEKNLNVWRQLWRVVEMSDVLVQIVDARDPELFRCSDLETYTTEVSSDKLSILLLNKADLLTENQRKVWAAYYQSIGVKFYFFSAMQVEKVKKENDEGKSEVDINGDEGKSGEAVVDTNDVEDDGEDDDESSSSYEDEDEKYPTLEDARYSNESDESSEMQEVPWSGEAEGIVGRGALIKLLQDLHREMYGEKEKLLVGFCGYPNVGKSSTINKLMGEKRVTVSATPGKTKHFQSLFLEDDLCVLDCPGLVFPNFVTNKATMVCSGLLPIDQMRDYRSPGSVVCQRIKRKVLEAQYGLVLPEPDQERGIAADTPPTVDELFSSYAFVRGFFGASGAPNQSRAARLILKDYVNGVLRYVAAPPGELGKDFDTQEGQEDACRKKLDFVERNERPLAAGETRRPTYQEFKVVPEVKETLLVSHAALEQGRKHLKAAQDKRKKKRGGRGKHRGEAEFPYGMPPDKATF